MQKMPQKQVTILAIEDNQDILGLIGRILGSEGYRVILAADGKFGIDLIRASEPDLVILDINMAYPDGNTVLKLIREFSNVPVMMVTAVWDKSQFKKLYLLEPTPI